MRPDTQTYMPAIIFATVLAAIIGTVVLTFHVNDTFTLVEDYYKTRFGGDYTAVRDFGSCDIGYTGYTVKADKAHLGATFGVCCKFKVVRENLMIEECD